MDSIVRIDHCCMAMLSHARYGGVERLDSRVRRVLAGPILRDAARTGDLRTLKAVLQEVPPNSPQLQDTHGTGPLHVAAAAGQEVAVTALLHRQADIHAVDLHGKPCDAHRQ